MNEKRKEKKRAKQRAQFERGEVAATLVCALIPPGCGPLPAPIHLLPGDSLHITVTYGGDLDARFEQTYDAKVMVTIEFDYMRVKVNGTGAFTLRTTS